MPAPTVVRRSGFLPATVLSKSFDSRRILALTQVKGHLGYISVIKYHHSYHYDNDDDDELQKQIFVP